MTDSTPGTWGADALPDPPPPPAAEPAAGSGAPDDAAAAPDGEPAQGAPSTRRRTILIASVAAGVVILGTAAAVLAGAFGGSEPVAAPSASTITLPSPTPTIEPAARQLISPFADALPSSVLAYALTGIVEHPPLIAAGALEGYRADYSDGSTGAVALLAGQWETPVEAVAAYNTMAAIPPAAAGAAATPDPSATPAPPTSGTVEVGGQPVGSWTITTAADGTATATWTNGTALFQAVGPGDVVADLYQAFPL